MKRNVLKRFAVLCVCLLSFLCLFWVKPINEGGMSESKVYASSVDLIEIQRLDAQMTVNTNRSVDVHYTVTVKFLTHNTSMFYLALPKQGCRYENFNATCDGNADFYFNVKNNPDVEGFIDVNCVGGVQKGRVWTYTISYTCIQNQESWKKNGMIIDVIGFGSTVPLHNVTTTINFPNAIQSSTVYVGDSETPYAGANLAPNGKTLSMQFDVLSIDYNDRFEEYTAQGVTLDFTMDGLDSYAETNIFTKGATWTLITAVIAVAVAVAVLLLTKKSRETMPIVNVHPPKDMDPLVMGKLLDGVIDSEDVTSMIYYFAHQGYLKIDMTDEKDPLLISLVSALPDGAPTHQKTLFNGLFKGGREISGDNTFEETASSRREIRVSQLVPAFFEESEKAKKQLPQKSAMYDKKSLFGYFFGTVLGFLFAGITAYIFGKKLGGGYNYVVGFALGIPLLANLIIRYIVENYRYKWKAKKRGILVAIEWGIAVASALIFSTFLGLHIATFTEKLLICIGAFLPALITQGAIARSDQYMDELNHVLGFKEFIVVTEEEKIKFMLENDPELYYKVLPYAQVLGVTDEWTDKFRKLTVQPPSWYVGAELDVFDYLIIHHAMRVAMRGAIAEMAKKSSGGGHIGRGGGGGSFGGFGGGGFGGGGFGAR